MNIRNCEAMDRADAERVFALIGQLHGELEDRLVPDRWWLVWTLMGAEILVTNSVTHLLILRGDVRPGVHFGLFVTQIIALAGTIRIAQRHSGGLRTQREWFIWWIWTTFLLAAGLLISLTLLLRLPVFLFASGLPMLAAFGFSMMGMAVHRGFTIASVAFVACSIMMAAFPAWQFLVYGLTWFGVLEVFGHLHRPAVSRVGKAL